MSLKNGLKEGLLIGSHQPMFLPSLNFFRRINFCDIFDFSGSYDLVTEFSIRSKILEGENNHKYVRSLINKKDINKYNFFDTKLDVSLLPRLINTIDKYYGSEPKKFPYYKKLKSDIFTIISVGYEENLYEYHISIIDLLMCLLEIKTKVETPKENKDLSIKSNPSNTILNQLKFYQKENNIFYLSGMSGKKYLDLKEFEKNGIEVLFVNDTFSYKDSDSKLENVNENFSILDTLFRFGLEKTRDMIHHGYTYTIDSGEDLFTTDYFNDR